MIRLLIDKALDNRFIVLSMAVFLFLWGIVAFKTLPVEAYPDVANTLCKSSHNGRAARRKKSNNRSQFQ